jgi:hypothetical protein
MSHFAILVDGFITTAIWVDVCTVHAVACVPQTVAVATIPGIKFDPVIVTVPPAYIRLGKI